jgi:EpsI family protein
VLAALMFVAGDVGSSVRLQQLSLILMVTAGVLLLFGRQVFRHIWFAIAYLLLMVPVWTELISRLQVPSQIISGRIAVVVFHAIGIPALQESTLIYLPKVTLEVLRECSGVNQLVAIFAVTVPAAYLWLDGSARRITFVGAALMVGYLSNGFRIALIGVLAQNGLPTSDPTVHLFEGLIVAAVGYGLVGVLFSWLAKPGWSNRTEETVVVTAYGLSLGPRRPAIDAVCLAIVIIAGSTSLIFSRTDVNLKAQLATLPPRIDEWSLEPTQTPTSRVNDVDDEAQVTYRRTSGERVTLYIGYQRHQQAGKGLTNAQPTLEHGAVPSVLNVTELGSLTELNQIEQRSESMTRHVLYWFDLDGRLATSRYKAKTYVFWNAVTRRRTNGAVVAVAWQCRASESDVTRQRALEFIRALMPILPRYLPSSAA